MKAIFYTLFFMITIQAPAQTEKTKDTIIIEFENNSQSEEIYDALAWTGLMGSGTWDPNTYLYSNSTIAWQNLSLNERMNIYNIRQNYLNNNPNCQ